MKLLIIALLLLVGVNINAYADSGFKEVDNYFTFKGKPIHPFLLEKFSNWISDYRPPIIVAVDVVAAFETNEYQNEIVKKLENGWWFAERGEDVSNYESFEYKWHGKMANGIHVVEVGSNGGGSGTFMDLIFLKVSEGSISWEDKQEKQVVLTIVKTFNLGDRYDGEVKVFPNKVLIKQSKNQYGGGAIDHDIELTF